MSAQLEVILTDRGGSQQPQPASGRAPLGEASRGAPFERTPGPRDQVTGPRKTDKSVLAAFDTAALKLGDTLGVGGLTGAAIELRRAFTDLFESVSATKWPRPDASAPRPSDSKAASRKAEREAREGVTGPRKRDERRETGPAASPQQSVMELAPSGPPAQTTVTGPPKPPPITGPAAAADSAVDAEIVGPAAAETGLTGLAAAAGPAAIAVATLTASAVAGGAAIKKVADGLHSEAQRLASYSGALAGATARSDIRAELADIRRAQRIGPQLGRLEDTRGKAMEALSDIITSFLDEMLKRLDKLEPAFALMTDLMSGVAKNMGTIIQSLEVITVVPVLLETLLDLVGKLAEMIRRWFGWAKDEKEKADDLKDPFMEQFLAMFGGPKPAAGVAGKAPMAAPAFGFGGPGGFGP